MTSSEGPFERLAPPNSAHCRGMILRAPASSAAYMDHGGDCSQRCQRHVPRRSRLLAVSRYSGVTALVWLVEGYLRPPADSYQGHMGVSHRPAAQAAGRMVGDVCDKSGAGFAGYDLVSSPKSCLAHFSLCLSCESACSKRCFAQAADFVGCRSLVHCRLSREEGDSDNLSAGGKRGEIHDIPSLPIKGDASTLSASAVVRPRVQHGNRGA